MISDSTTISPAKSPSGPALMRVAVICDYLEEKWPSMDLVGDQVVQALATGHSSEISVEQLRPRLKMRASRFPLIGSRGFSRNADRLVNRFRDYPKWLRQHVSRFDLFHIIDHSYAQLALELPPERTLIHCHDLDTFRCVLTPEQEPRPAWFRAMAQRTLKGLRRAAHVVCVSETTRTELLKFGILPADRVSVIYSGVDERFTRVPEPESDDAIKRLLGIDAPGEPCILHVGSTIKRKRIDVLLRAFAAILGHYPGARLVRVGGPFTLEQASLAASLGVADKIVNTPFLNTPMLAAVYRRAALLLQTSDAEGFGLPVIEAQACGCPVVASDIPVLREAAGPAAAYCSVDDTSAWSGTIQRLLSERISYPEQWEKRRQHGVSHAQRFSWTRTAEELIGVYRLIAASREGGRAQ